MLKGLPAPPLELFDLEDAFSSERTRLAQVANKCLVSSGDGNINEDADIEFFIHECAQIVRPTESSKTMNMKQVLYELAVELCQFKRLNQSD